MTQPATERVNMLITNRPGVLDRVVKQIRYEGWNIKRLFVDETDVKDVSRMEIDIEGTHTKLAQVMDKILGLDCVISIEMTQDGEKITKKRTQIQTGDNYGTAKDTSTVPEKKSGVNRILTINPGSTSTKFAVFDDDETVLIRTIRYDERMLEAVGSIPAQKELRMESILEVLEESNVPLESLDAIAGRGGLLKPIESGTYLINDKMLADLNTASGALHASSLGAIIAVEIAKHANVDAYVVDPIVVDEMDRNAKLTGMPGIERASVFHALNQKAVARRLATELGQPYENLRLVVAHLGGGITVGAHKYGRVIDVNDALSGEGAFTPERTGGLPAIPLIEMCFSGEYTKEEMLSKITKKGGMSAYLGTSDLKSVQKMINDGDEFAALVLDSMAYQVSKEIGAIAAVLDSDVDAIILTGGLAYSTRFTGAVKQRVSKLAQVHVYPGEDEMLALMEGVLRVLRGQEQVALYE